MLKPLLDLLRVSDFVKKEDGNIFITTALVAPLLVLAIGIGVDTAEIYRAKVNFQNSVDAATIVVTKIVAAEGGGAAVQTKARLAGTHVFNANMRNLDPDPGKANIDFIIADIGCGAGSVSAVATLDHAVFFNALHNVAKNSTYPDHVTLNAEAEVECANSTMEIALVLDNSGSMGGDRLPALEEAATNLVTTLHQTMAGSPAEDPIKFSLVPFNGSVNVGTNNISASWMDTEGISPIHHENFDWALDPSVYKDGDVWRNRKTDEIQTRFTMFDVLGEPWGGCVESRPFPMNTNVTVPDSSNPITLFVPWFAPDEPDNRSNLFTKVRSTDPADEKVICEAFNLTEGGEPVPAERQWCVRWSDGLTNVDRHPQDIYYTPTHDDGIEYSDGEYVGDSTPGGAGPWIDDVKLYEHTKTLGNSYLVDHHNFPTTLHDNPFATQYGGFDINDVDAQNMMKRQNWTWKYFAGAEVTTKFWHGYWRGPNFGCSAKEITPLTSNEDEIIIELGNMHANGQTNIHQGVAWGWRTLTPDEPFADGREMSNPNNHKVLIVLTDGRNFDMSAYGNGSIYGVYGFEKNGRRWGGVPDSLIEGKTGGTRLRKSIDFHLATTCENARDVGITIFTIAFNIPDGEPVKTLMEECSSVSADGGRQYFDAKNNDQLKEYFAEIAQRLSELKVVR